VKSDLKRTVHIRGIASLLVAGLTAAPAFAAELRVTGFIDNTFPRWDKNLSSVDNDTTRGSDRLFAGRSRMRAFFNFIASDDLRGVFAIEYDAGSYSHRQIRRKAHAFKRYAGQIWGAPSHARVRHLGYLLQKINRRSVALYAPWD
jgi:hypothetical protein